MPNPFSNVSLGLALSAVLFVAAILFASFSFVLIKLAPEEDQVLGPYSEAKVLSTVAGAEAPAVLEAGDLSIGQDRCVHADELIQVEVTIAFRRLDEGEPEVVPFLERANQTRAPGCNFAIFTVPLPSAVKPGMWRLEGISRVLSTSEIRYWSSEPFAVVPAR